MLLNLPKRNWNLLARLCYNRNNTLSNFACCKLDIYHNTNVCQLNLIYLWFWWAHWLKQ